MRIPLYVFVVIPPVLFFLLGLLYPTVQLLFSGLVTSSTSTSLWEDPFIRHVITFTYTQALCSAFLSLLVGTTGAIIFSEQRFWGRAFFWRASLVCYSLPSILVVLAILGFWGNGIYGWPAILLANTFFNFPLFLKAVGNSLSEMNRDEEKAALSLGANRWICFFRVTLPKILPELKSTFVLTFLLCSSASFLVVLLLGGGPSFTTLEVAIYQAVKVDYEPALAARLGIIQMLVAVVLYLCFLRGEKPAAERNAGAFFPLYLFRRSGINLFFRAVYFLFMAFLVVGPLAILVVSGLSGSWPTDWNGFFVPVVTSLKLGAMTSVITLVLASAFAYFERHVPFSQLKTLISILAGLPLSLSTILVTLSLVVAFPSFYQDYRGYLLPIAVVQSLVALPVVYRPIRDGFFRIPDSLYQASASLGATSFRTLCLVEFPLLRKSIGVACLLAIAFSLGEVGAVMLFQTEEIATLPLQMFRLMGQYRFDQAYHLGLLLLGLMGTIFWLTGELET